MCNYKHIFLFVFFLSINTLSQQFSSIRSCTKDIFKLDQLISSQNYFDQQLETPFVEENHFHKTTASQYFEETIDSIVYLKIDGDKIKTNYSYDSNKRIIIQSTFKWINGGWIPFQRTSRDFDSFGNMIFEQIEAFTYQIPDAEEINNNSGWTSLSKVEKKYNNFSKRIFEAHYTWHGGWREDRSVVIEYNLQKSITDYHYKQRSSGENWKHEYSYDKFGRKEEVIRYNLLGGNFEFISKWEYDYSDNHYTLISKHFNWQNDEWKVERISSQVLDNYENILEEKFVFVSEDKSKKSYLHNYEFSNNLRLSEKSYKLINNNWELYRTSENKYDDNNNLIFLIYKEFENSLLISGERRSFSYNSNQKEILFLYERLENNSWILQHKTTRAYNKNQKMLTFKSRIFNNQQNYFECYELLNEYDINENRLSSEIKRTKDDVFISSELSKFGYDSQNRMVFATNFIWKDNKYEMSDGYNYESPIYFNMESPYHEIYIYYQDGQQISRNDQTIKSIYSISQNYPNPFNPSTIISFSNSKHANIKITLFNSIGEKVRVLVNKFFSLGSHYLQINSNGLPSGTYFYRLEVEGFAETKKMIILK